MARAMIQGPPQRGRDPQVPRRHHRPVRPHRRARQPHPRLPAQHRDRPRRPRRRGQKRRARQPRPSRRRRARERQDPPIGLRDEARQEGQDGGEPDDDGVPRQVRHLQEVRRGQLSTSASASSSIFFFNFPHAPATVPSAAHHRAITSEAGATRRPTTLNTASKAHPVQRRRAPAGRRTCASLRRRRCSRARAEAPRVAGGTRPIARGQRGRRRSLRPLGRPFLCSGSGRRPRWASSSALRTPLSG